MVALYNAGRHQGVEVGDKRFLCYVNGNNWWNNDYLYLESF